jgi:hypothetical protein
MWIVAGDMAYYPWVNEFETYEEAKEYFDKQEPYEETVYIAEVKDTKKG